MKKFGEFKKLDEVVNFSKKKENVSNRILIKNICTNTILICIVSWKYRVLYSQLILYIVVGLLNSGGNCQKNFRVTTKSASK